MFPFQIYLLSQAEGDTAGVRTESEILEGYLMQLLPLCIRIVSSAQSAITTLPSAQPTVLTSLTATPLDVLLPYVLSILYMGHYSLHIAANLRTDLMELTQAWCSLMLLCGVDVGIGSMLSSRVRKMYSQPIFIILCITRLLSPHHGISPFSISL